MPVQQEALQTHDTNDENQQHVPVQESVHEESLHHPVPMTGYTQGGAPQGYHIPIQVSVQGGAPQSSVPLVGDTQQVSEQRGASQQVSEREVNEPVLHVPKVPDKEKTEQMKLRIPKLKKKNKQAKNTFACLQEESTDRKIEAEVPQMFLNKKMTKPIQNKQIRTPILNCKNPSDEHWYFQFKRCSACLKSHAPKPKYCRWLKQRRDIKNEFNKKNKKKVINYNIKLDEETIQLINNKIEQLQ